MNRRLAGVALSLVGSSVAALAFAGCGDDTGSTPGPDAGGDAAPDATTQDAGADQTTKDAPGDQTTADAGSDASDGNDGANQPLCVVPDAARLDASSVEAGFFAVWQTYRCQGCHQKRSSVVDDAGNGIVLSGNNDGIGDSGMVFPPNLTDDPVTGLGCWTDSQIVNSILHGTRQDGGSLCPSMPKWGNGLMNVPPDGGFRAGTPMDAGTAQAIVDFMRSLPVVSNAVQSTMCPMVFDAGREGGVDAGSDAADSGSPDAGDAADGGADAAADGSDAGDGARE